VIGVDHHLSPIPKSAYSLSMAMYSSEVPFSISGLVSLAFPFGWSFRKGAGGRKWVVGSSKHVILKSFLDQKESTKSLEFDCSSWVLALSIIS